MSLNQFLKDIEEDMKRADRKEKEGESELLPIHLLNAFRDEDMSVTEKEEFLFF